MPRILLIEDDDAIRELVTLMLTQEGHSVVTAANGREGLAKFQVGAFDLLITDLVMPEREGIEVLREIQGKDAALKTIAMSGGGKFGGTDTYLRLAVLLGAQTVLPKPFTRDQFMAAVSDALGEARGS
jgi:CheY-like chemotaxis protein